MNNKAIKSVFAPVVFKPFLHLDKFSPVQMLENVVCMTVHEISHHITLL